jgi:hypothetical protein
MIAFYFLRGVERESRNLLDKYCQALGQRINREKSSIYFTKGCPQARRDIIKNILDINNEALNERYLGMPTDVGSSKYGTFKFLRDSVWGKIKGWLEKILTAKGKEVLINQYHKLSLHFPWHALDCHVVYMGILTHLSANFGGATKKEKETQVGCYGR